MFYSKAMNRSYQNAAAAVRAERRSVKAKAKAKAERRSVGSDYAALREQWELAGGNAGECPFGEDYAGPSLDWDGNEWLIRSHLPAKELL